MKQPPAAGVQHEAMLLEKIKAQDRERHGGPDEIPGVADPA